MWQTLQEFANLFLFDKLSWIAKVNQEIVLNENFAKHYVTEWYIKVLKGDAL